jgi:AcrR family transcriptional regulator
VHDHDSPVQPHRPRPTQQQRRAATEQRLLDAAVRLIASSGSSSVSLADIGKAAGYSRGIVTHQFGTRDEMLRQVARYAQQTFVPPESDARGLERLLVVIDAYLAYVEGQPPAGRAFLLMWGEAAAAHSRLRLVFAERDAMFCDLLRSYIDEGVKEGSVRADVNPAAAATAIMGQLRGIGLKLMLDPGASSAETIRHETVEMTRHALEVSGR